MAFGNLRPPDLAHLLEYKFDMSAKIISNDNIIYEFESDDRLNRLARILIAAKLDPSRREAFIGNNEIFNGIIHGILKYNTNKYSPSERKEKLYLGDPEGWKSDLNEHQVQETLRDILSVSYDLGLRYKNSKEIKDFISDVFYPHILDENRLSDMANQVTKNI